MRKSWVAFIILGLLLVACNRSAEPLPTATSIFANGGDENVQNTPFAPQTEPAVTVVTIPTSTVRATDTDVSEAMETATPLESATPLASLTSTATSGPTATPLGTQIDPLEKWGAPTFVDPMDESSYDNWAGADGLLPDTQFIKLVLRDGELLASGKQLGFETWWFSWPYISNFYIEMKVDNGTCVGKDSYGAIIRGPDKGATNAYGYMLGFSCDGYYRFSRLNSSTPFQSVELIPWTKSVAIPTGSDQEIFLGIEALGDEFTIYANRYEIAKFSDSHYPAGRYGLYVFAGGTAGYTYVIDEIAYWVIAQ